MIRHRSAVVALCAAALCVPPPARAQEYGEDEMTFGEEPASTPAVPPVEAPPPAAQSLAVPAAIAVRATSAPVVAGRSRAVPIEISTPPSVRALEGTATEGDLEAPRRREPGLFEATLRLPRIDSPRVIVVVFHGDGCAGAVRIPIGTEAEPSGGGRPAALVIPPAERLVADDGQVHGVLVAAADADGGAAGEFALTTETGAVGEPAEIRPGLRIYPWRPSRALGRFDLVATVGGSEARGSVEMVAGPPAGIEVVAEPDVLPADGVSTSVIHAGVTDGLGHFLEAGLVEMMIEGGHVVQQPAQIGPAVVAAVAADSPPPYGGPPAAILITARGGGYEGTAGLRQFDPAARRLAVSFAVAALPADGASEAPVAIALLDGLGVPLPADAAVVLSASGGEIQRDVSIRGGSGSATFRAGTAAGIATVRAALEGAEAIATVMLEPGPPDRLRVDVEEHPDDPGRYVVRARLEDRNGNGVPPSTVGGGAGFQATASEGSVGAFGADDGSRGVAWMVASLEVPPERSRATRVEVAAGGLVGRAIVEAPSSAAVYVSAAGGYVHNLGEVGIVTARLGVGWMNAFALDGFLLGIEAGFQFFEMDGLDPSGRTYDTRGWAIPLYGTFGYRLPLSPLFCAWGIVALGADIAWFEVDGPPGGYDASAGPRAAFSAGVRLGAGIALGPGVVTLELTYDDARFEDVVYGNVGGLGGTLGYRLEL